MTQEEFKKVLNATIEYAESMRDFRHIRLKDRRRNKEYYEKLRVCKDKQYEFLKMVAAHPLIVPKVIEHIENMPEFDNKTRAIRLLLDEHSKQNSYCRS